MLSFSSTSNNVLTSFCFKKYLFREKSDKGRAQYERSLVKHKNSLGDVYTHMHKMSPRGPKHYIFGNNFYSKNFRKLIFHVFLHFNARKHMRSSFYLKWTEFTKNRYFGSTWTHNWNKIHNFLWIGFTSGKMMMSHVFLH